MSTGNDLEWAKRLRAQLTVDIQTLRARAREGPTEDPGFQAEGDRLSDLYRRLEQVDRLIDAMEEASHEGEAGWPAHLNDPAAKDSLGKRH